MKRKTILANGNQRPLVSMLPTCLINYNCIYKIMDLDNIIVQLR